MTYKNEEIEKLNQSRMAEIDRVMIESYDKAEKRFYDNLKIKEAKF